MSPTLRRAALASILVLALLAAASSGTAATAGGRNPDAAKTEEPLVIVLSWDGFRHDYLDRAEFDALGRMEREGARAERLVPVFPSNTFPNHVSLATGTYPDRHGIVDNRFLDRERGRFSYGNDASWLQAEPLWVTAERQGVRAAVFFWVGSTTDWNGTGASYRKRPFDGRLAESEKVDQILAWLDLPATKRPGLVMAWWHGADGVGHMKGPDHPDVVERLHEQDTQLARLLAGLDARDAWPRTTLLIVSDHGMTPVSEAVDLDEVLAEHGIAARATFGSSLAHVFLDEPGDVAEAEQRLRDVAGIRSVYRGEALPDALRLRHPTRTGDLVLATEPPYTFYRVDLRTWLLMAAGRLLGWRKGMHGYAPDHPDMGATFLALGRGVPSGTRLGPVRVIDVAPTVTRLLGIEPPRHCEGVPVEALATERKGEALASEPQGEALATEPQLEAPTAP